MVQRRNSLLAGGRAGLVTLAMATIAMAPAPVRADSFTAAQKAEIEAIIKTYLMEQPEILREAAGELEAREKIAEAKAREKVVADPSGPLFSSEHQPVVGNPSGKVTLVEFFDYNCGYCKRALHDMTRLMQANPDLRVILRDLPILSDGSVEAAKVANAASKQLKGQKFWEFHQKLLGSRGQVGKEQALTVAKEAGADMDRLEKDLAAAGATTGIDESTQLAKALQLNGTPTFVIGQEVVIGAVGFDELQSKVSNVRKCGKTACS